jgi:hypothetical protein
LLEEPELVECAVVEVAALAIAAPPPATAAVTTRVVRRGFIRWLIGFTSFGWPGRTMRWPRLKSVGGW